MAFNQNLFGLQGNMPGRTATTQTTLPGLPDASARKFATGIPGFDELSGMASGNVKNLLAGTEDPGITRNMNAEWGAASGMAPGSEYLNNRAIDLYGQRGAARKQQGFQDLLAMLQGYSGTVVASPGQIFGDEASRRSADLEAKRLAQSGSQFAQQLAFDRERQAAQLDLENRRFGQQQQQYYGSRPNTPGPSQMWSHLYGAGGNGFMGGPTRIF